MPGEWTEWNIGGSADGRTAHISVSYPRLLEMIQRAAQQEDGELIDGPMQVRLTPANPDADNATAKRLHVYRFQPDD